MSDPAIRPVKLAVWQTTGEVIRLLWRQRAAFLTAAVAPWFVIATTDWLPSAIYGGEEAAEAVAPAVLFIRLLFYSMFFVTCQRTVLIGKQDGFSAFSLRLGRHELKIFGLFLCVIFIFVILFLAVFFSVPIDFDFECDESYFRFSAIFEEPICAAYVFGTDLIFYMVASVFCVLFSSISVGRKIPFKISLQKVQGNILRIFFVLVILNTITSLMMDANYLLVSYFVPVTHGGGMYLKLYIETLIELLDLAAFACAFSLAYERLVVSDQSQVGIE